MSEPSRASAIIAPGAGLITHPYEAKARLLAWADDTDARTRIARSSMGKTVARGALAALGAIVVARILTPGRRAGPPRSLATTTGKRLVKLAVVARAGKWLLPYAIKAVQQKMKNRPRV